MKKLSFEKLEKIEGGQCSFEETMYYITATMYHLGQLDSGNQYWYYHMMGINYNTARVMACM